MLNTRPLVSIIIITYNSATFVMETLESAKNQTYENIELIISDDGSSDNTVELCTEWLKQNNSSFVHTQLVTTQQNTGIPANCNRGLKSAQGEWVKFIAGDDVLMPNCVRDNVLYVTTHKNVRVVFSKTKKYLEEICEKTFHTNTRIRFDFFNLEKAVLQYKSLLLGDKLTTTPSSFLHKETIVKVGLFDERFKLIEDYPMWLKLTKSGFKLNFMDKFTVSHRIHEGATNNIGTNFLIKPAYFRNEEMRKVYVYPNLPLIFYLNQKYSYQVALFLKFIGANKNTKLNMFLLNLLRKHLNIFRYLIFMQRKMNL